MIQEENLDIRTITMGISLLDCCDSDIQKACGRIYEKITRRAERLVRTGEEIEREFDGRGYGDFKKAVGESVVELLRPIREETERLLADKAYLESVYRAGAEKAAYVANRTLSKVYKKVGFLAR